MEHYSLRNVLSIVVILVLVFSYPLSSSKEGELHDNLIYMNNNDLNKTASDITTPTKLPKPNNPFGKNIENVPFETLLNWNKKQIIDYAIQYALNTKSDFLPKNYDAVKVYLDADGIEVIFGEGMKAYDYNGGRRMDKVFLTVRIYKNNKVVTGSEGDMKMTKRDYEILDFVLKSNPYKDEENDIVIEDHSEKDSYNVSLEGEFAVGIYEVNKKTGEWTYITHKRYAGNKGESRKEII
jgi:hypothetical protein